LENEAEEEEYEEDAAREEKATMVDE